MLSRAALEQLGARSGVTWPWQRRHSRVDLDLALGGRTRAPRASDDPTGELVGARLLDAEGGVRAPVLGVLSGFARPQASVDVDLAGRRTSGAPGFAQLRSWQRLAAGRVTTLTVAGPTSAELAWFDTSGWQGELARLVRVDDTATDPPPDPVVELPLETLLASGAALRSQRDGAFAELAARAVGQVGPDAERSWNPARTADQLRRVHEGVSARLQAVVAGPGPTGRRTLGLISWLRYADGWREVTPLPRAQRPRLRLAPVSPSRLGAEVARLTLGVLA